MIASIHGIKTLLEPCLCYRQKLALTLSRSVYTGWCVSKEEDGSRANESGKEMNLVVSSLRIDTVAAAGLDISRKQIWEACLDGHVIINGEQIKKKSASVKEGDTVEVDTVLKPKESQRKEFNSEADWPVRRGRVVVKEIGTQTRKGGYHLTILRFKHFALFNKRQIQSPTPSDST